MLTSVEDVLEKNLEGFDKEEVLRILYGTRAKPLEINEKTKEYSELYNFEVKSYKIDGD